MATVNIQDSIQSVHTSLDHIIQTAEGLKEETIRWKPSEEEWSIMQILCHLVEALQYWLDEIEHLLEFPDTEWGRGLQHEGRLMAVAESAVERQSVQDVLKEIEAEKVSVEKVLSKLDEEKLNREAPSRNPRFGTKPLSFIVDHLLVEHASKHDGQIQRNLSKLNN
ncbi:DinB family protein [Salipaludibacillus sp. CF4.18]|uniref:DinB family protein n=1 Tax=Salipaludibacillus sp. CF4.18 TaxID=3373081 RepID=UPI003EE58D9B